MNRKFDDAMRKREANLSHDRLLEVLLYDPEIGIFVWVERPSSRCRVKVGDIAGCRRNDHLCIGLDGYSHPAHRLAWFYMTKEWPKDEVDHEDLDGFNNRWKNLRPATHQQNMRNRKCFSPVGFKGVTVVPNRHESPYQAQITIDGKNHFIGRYNTPELAHEAYQEKAKQIYGDFARFE